LAVTLILGFLYSLTSVRYLLIVLLAFFGISIAVWVGFDHLVTSRQAEVFDLEEASSWVARMELQERAIAHILESPVLGQFGGHVEFGKTSGYAHNFLSAWVNYGFFGVALYLYLIVVATVGSGLKIWKKKTVPAYWELTFLFNAVSLILVFVSKSVFWPVPALGWGVYALALILDREHRALDRKSVAPSKEAVVETNFRAQVSRQKRCDMWSVSRGGFSGRSAL
jgi:O-antigen ligase